MKKWRRFKVFEIAFILCLILISINFLWLILQFFLLPIIFLSLMIFYWPLKILFWVGMQMPGNKYNLTFSFNGQRKYSSKRIAFSFVLVLIVVIYYSFITFRKVGENLNVVS